MECPDFLEIEEFIAGSDLTLRVPRSSVEKVLGRGLTSRNDFMAWLELHREALLRIGLGKCLQRGGYEVGTDPTIEILAADLSELQ